MFASLIKVRSKPQVWDWGPPNQGKPPRKKSPPSQLFSHFSFSPAAFIYPPPIFSRERINHKKKRLVYSHLCQNQCFRVFVTSMFSLLIFSLGAFNVTCSFPKGSHALRCMTLCARLHEQGKGMRSMFSVFIHFSKLALLCMTFRVRLY